MKNKILFLSVLSCVIIHSSMALAVEDKRPSNTETKRQRRGWISEALCKSMAFIKGCHDSGDMVCYKSKAGKIDIAYDSCKSVNIAVDQKCQGGSLAQPPTYISCPYKCDGATGKCIDAPAGSCVDLDVAAVNPLLTGSYVEMKNADGTSLLHNDVCLPGAPKMIGEQICTDGNTKWMPTGQPCPSDKICQIDLKGYAYCADPVPPYWCNDLNDPWNKSNSAGIVFSINNSPPKTINNACLSDLNPLSPEGKVVLDYYFTLIGKDKKDSVVIDAICKNNLPAMPVPIECPAGEICQGGICKEKEIIITCDDSEESAFKEGKASSKNDPYFVGEVKTTKDGIASPPIPDYCDPTNKQIVWDVVCNGDPVKIECSPIEECQNGKCVPKPIVKECKDTEDGKKDPYFPGVVTIFENGVEIPPPVSDYCAPGYPNVVWDVSCNEDKTGAAPAVAVDCKTNEECQSGKCVSKPVVKKCTDTEETAFQKGDAKSINDPYHYGEVQITADGSVFPPIPDYCDPNNLKVVWDISCNGDKTDSLSTLINCQPDEICKSGKCVKTGCKTKSKDVYVIYGDPNDAEFIEKPDKISTFPNKEVLVSDMNGDKASDIIYMDHLLYDDPKSSVFGTPQKMLPAVNGELSPLTVTDVFDYDISEKDNYIVVRNWKSGDSHIWQEPKSNGGTFANFDSLNAIYYCSDNKKNSCFSLMSDLNGDGFLDGVLFYGEYNDDNGFWSIIIDIYFGNNTAKLWPDSPDASFTILQDKPISSMNLVLADNFNSKDHRDMIFISSFNNEDFSFASCGATYRYRITRVVNDESGKFVAPTITETVGPKGEMLWNATSGDLNNDGLADLVIATHVGCEQEGGDACKDICFIPEIGYNGFAEKIRFTTWLSGLAEPQTIDDNMTFVMPPNKVASGWRFRPNMYIADVNNDGSDDIIFKGKAGAANEYLEFLGFIVGGNSSVQKYFLPKLNYWSTSYDVQHVLLMDDFNQDGCEDFILKYKYQGNSNKTKDEKLYILRSK